MSLVLRFTILFLIVSMVVFGVGGVITYHVMKREIDFEQRAFLMERLSGIESYIIRRDINHKITRQKWSITPLPELVEETEPVFSDTIVTHATLERPEPHLKLEVIKNINGRSFDIIVFDLIIESDDINDVVTESLTKTFLILLVSFTALGLLIFYFQMRPFQRVLEIIKKFSISGTEPVVFPKTTISDFRRLNLFLKEMTEKVRRDYRSLKEFSENASHELQTPIAIMLGKLDILLEDETLTESQLEQISSIQFTAKRLSNLSNSLSLLTKIENQEFPTKASVDVREKLERILLDFKELFDLKSIKTSTEIQGEIILQADPVLIEILLTNLVNNAIRHNNEEGVIKVSLINNQLIVSNTGSELKSSPDELFQRFKKSNQSNASMGLGLAIVKKICELYGYEITYENEKNYHHLKVTF